MTELQMRNSEPSTSHASPTADDIRQATTRLYESVKLVAFDVCPQHPAKALCLCTTDLINLASEEVFHIKTEYFVRLWDLVLLRGTGYAFDYTGDQASHHAFTAKAGKNPKHFVRDWMQKGPISDSFAPAGRLQDTVQAMIDYWIMRNAQWKVRYGDHATAAAKWLVDEYGEHAGKVNIEGAVLMKDKSHPTRTVKTTQATYGSPGHKCSFKFLPVGDIGGTFGGKLLEQKLCHDRCSLSAPQYRDAQQAHILRVSEELGFDEDCLEILKSAAERR